jgi:murein DD-endopeptidase MepM/ murein hydrolase activator NlpD
VATQLSQILSGYLGGGRSTQKGDRWQLVVEELWAEDQRIAFGDILAARYAPVEKPDAVSIYRFESEGAALGFYQEDGSTLDHIFQASPIPGARITSGFSTRFHPVLKVMKPHLGVDYSAPIGTPVRAIGDGRIVQMTYHENLGKMIKVRHGYGFETVYGHMRGFAGNAVLGQSIKKGDVIGYVGMTGRTTGPHLHFAMLQNKRFVNPVKIAVPKKDHLTGSTLVAFQAFVERIKSEMMIF